jgi:hypothetical protein
MFPSGPSDIEGVGGQFNTVAKKAPSDELGAERRTSMKGNKAR